MKKKPICKIKHDGTKEWSLNGKLHREDGPAMEWANGTKSWWLNDKLHRESGPAIERVDGYKAWFLNGERHREDGPAIVGADDGYEVWYLNDKKYSEPDFYRKLYKLGKITKEELFIKLI